MSVEIRKIVTTKEDVDFEGFTKTEKTIRRVTVAAVIKNPMAGRYVEDLSPIYDIGEELGDLLCRIASIGPQQAGSTGLMKPIVRSEPPWE